MDILKGSEIRTFLSSGWTDGPVTTLDIRTDTGYAVRSFSDLVSCVAKLAFYNTHQVLLFRGQTFDHKVGTTGRSALKPTIFRAKAGTVLKQEIPRRYRILSSAEDLLKQEWLDAGLEEPTRIARNRILRWAILQHYEVCPTPLLDVTHSLRVAASMATHGRKGRREGYVYVLAVPQLTGSTTTTDAELQIIRLSGICPPSARRPHFQEGYLLSESPAIQEPSDRENYKPAELDFGRRLLAKFRIQLGLGFWKQPFPMLNQAALFPEADPEDKLENVISRIKGFLADDTSMTRNMTLAELTEGVD